VLRVTYFFVWVCLLLSIINLVVTTVVLVAVHIVNRACNRLNDTTVIADFVNSFIDGLTDNQSEIAQEHVSGGGGSCGSGGGNGNLTNPSFPPSPSSFLNHSPVV